MSFFRENLKVNYKNQNKHFNLTKKKSFLENCFSSDVISVKNGEMVLKKSRNWRNGFHWRLFKKNFWSWRRIKWVMFKNVIIIVSESQIFCSFMPSTQNGSVNFVSNWRFSYDQDRIRIFQRCFQGRKLKKKSFVSTVFYVKLKLRIS